MPSANTAISAKEVAAQGDPTRAAIASEEAAAHYGLAVLRHDIQTSQTNTTRFLILSRDETPLAEPDKATVIFRVNDEVGALVKVLASFAEYGLNMSRIESRPLPDTPFQYFFSADFVGSMDAPHLRSAMDAARPLTAELRLLGVYRQTGCAREAAFLKKGPSLALPPGKMTVADSGGEAASLREAPLPQTPSPEERLALSGYAPSGLVPPEGWARVPVAWLWSRRLTEPPRPCGGGKTAGRARKELCAWKFYSKVVQRGRNQHVSVEYP